jgi:hypothetical protein
MLQAITGGECAGGSCFTGDIVAKGYNPFAAPVGCRLPARMSRFDYAGLMVTGGAFADGDEHDEERQQLRR